MTNTTTSPPSTPLTHRASILISQLGAYTTTRCAERLATAGAVPPPLWAAQSSGRGRWADLAWTRRRGGLDCNAMVGLVDDLEDRGLVQRRRHPSDRRASA